MKARLIAGGVLASLWLLGLPTWAVEYRLQVVNLDALTVLAHTDNSGPAPHGEARKSRLEARLDNGGFSAAAALPGRHVQLLQDPGYGGKPPASLQVLPNTRDLAWTALRDSAWTTLQWEGHPGDSVAFVVRSEMRGWQEVAAVAANPEGVLRRLVIGSGGWFERSRPEVREVSDDYLANAVAQGTFTHWLEQNKALNGISVVVGRGRSVFEQPDRVYAVLTLPPEPHTFRLVIGWRDHRRGGGSNNK
jgi:hypothetical protein